MKLLKALEKPLEFFSDLFEVFDRSSRFLPGHMKQSWKTKTLEFFIPGRQKVL